MEIGIYTLGSAFVTAFFAGVGTWFAFRNKRMEMVLEAYDSHFARLERELECSRKLTTDMRAEIDVLKEQNQNLENVLYKINLQYDDLMVTQKRVAGKLQETIKELTKIKSNLESLDPKFRKPVENAELTLKSATSLLRENIG